MSDKLTNNNHWENPEPQDLPWHIDDNGKPMPLYSDLITAVNGPAFERNSVEMSDDEWALFAEVYKPTGVEFEPGTHEYDELYNLVEEYGTMPKPWEVE